MKGGDTVQIIGFSARWPPEESNEEVEQTGDEENDGENDDDEEYAGTNLQGLVVETETAAAVRSNGGGGW